MTHLWTRRRLIALSAAVLAYACRRGAPGAQATTVTVELGEYFVKPDESRVTSGKVRFVANNVGSVEHELIVLRTDLEAGELPIDEAEDEVDEESAGQVIGEIEPEELPPGKSAEMTLDLTRGHYVLFCNIHSHYRLGMHADFRVE